MALLMTWDEGQTLTHRWEHAWQWARQERAHWKLGASFSGFTGALLKWTQTLVPVIVDRFRQSMQQQAGRFWTREGWLAMAVDGTRIEAPRTAANEAGLGCAGRKKTAPQVFLTTLWHLGLGLPWGYRLGPGTDSERTHLQDMIDDLPAHTLLVADAGFVSYPLCRALLQQDRSFLLRVGGNITLLSELGYYHQEQDGLVYLWPEARRDSRPLVLRLITLQGPQQPICLLTNVLEASELTDTTAAALYALRWGEEVFYRSYKQTLQRRTLKSRTPDTALAEAHWTLLGIWLLGLMSVFGLIAAGHDPLAWSVAASRDVVRRAVRNHHHGRSRRRLKDDLAHAIKDGYRRTRPRTARDFPRQKNEPAPRPPNIKPATTSQIQRATRHPPPNIPAKWTA